MTRQVGKTENKQAPPIVLIRTTGNSTEEPAPKGHTTARWFIGAGAMLVAAAAGGVWWSVRQRRRSAM